MSRRNKATRTGIDKWQVGVLAGLLATVPAALWTTADPVGVVKWTLLVAGALALAGLLVASHLETGASELRERTGLALVLVFLVAVVTVTVASPSGWLAIFGEYTFYQGLVTFLALAVLLLVVLSTRMDPASAVLRATTVGTGIVAVLTAGQFVGIDWFGYDPRMYGRVVTTLGNSNFGAAFLALTVPAALHLALFGRSQVERRASAAVAALASFEAIIIGSVQGPVTLAVSVATWLLLVAVSKIGVRASARFSIGAVLLAALAVATFWSHIYAEISTSFRVGRQGAWVSAWEQFREHPVLGVGLDHFGEHYTAYRPAYSAVRESERFTDAGQAHNVVLDLLADGGLVLGAAYVVLVVYTGYRGVRGLRCSFASGDRDRYAQLAAVFCVWLGYQVQALVSIDHVPLAIVHWVFMGLMLRLSREATGGAHLVIGRRRRVQSRSLALAGVGLVGAALLWAALVPIRADLAAGSTEQLEESGRPDEAIDALEKATSLMPFRPVYWQQLGLRVQAVHGAAAAAPYIERGARLDESNARIAMMMGQFYVAAGDDTSAQRWYEEALDRDPHNPDILREGVAFFERRGDDRRAAVLSRRLGGLPRPGEG